MIKEISAYTFRKELDNYDQKDKLVFITKYISDYGFHIDNDLELQIFVSKSFSMCIHRLRKKHSLYSYKDLIENGISVIEQYNLIDVSPLLIEEHLWKEIIFHELTLLNPREVTFKINYYIESLKQLSLRLQSDHIFNFNDFPEFDLLEDPLSRFEKDNQGNTKVNFYVNEQTGRGISYSENDFLVCSSDFSIPLKDYENFLAQIDFEQIEQYKKNDKVGHWNNLEKKVLYEYTLRKKLVLNSAYKQSELLRLLSSFQEKWLPKIDFNNFILNNIVFPKEMPENYYLKNEFPKNETDNKLNKEDALDLITLFKYLKDKNVLLNSRMNSDRKVAKVILDYFSFESNISFQIIRKQLSPKHPLQLAKEIQTDLNYYIKHIPIKDK